jgi:hypothetical protein
MLPPRAALPCGALVSIGVRSLDIATEALATDRRGDRFAGDGDVEARRDDADDRRCDGEPDSGQGDRPVEVHNVPFTVVPDVPLVVSKSSRYRYSDYGHSVDISDRNGYYSPFAYQS